MGKDCSDDEEFTDGSRKLFQAKRARFYETAGSMENSQVNSHISEQAQKLHSCLNSLYSCLGCILTLCLLTVNVHTCDAYDEFHCRGKRELARKA
jgi:hypothetical protein